MQRSQPSRQSLDLVVGRAPGRASRSTADSRGRRRPARRSSARVPAGTVMPTLAGDVRRRLADQRRVRQALGTDQRTWPARSASAARQEVAAAGAEGRAQRRRDRAVDDHRVGRRAQHAVVEGLAGEDVVGGLGDVGRRLDVARRVARADAVGRLAGRVGGAHQARARRWRGSPTTSRADISACVPASVTVVIQPMAPSGSPAARAASCMTTAVARDAARRRRVRADDDGAAGLDGDEQLVDRRRGRIGRRARSPPRRRTARRSR